MKLCCLFTGPSFYRLPIYKLIEKELNSDFFFGKKEGNTVKYFNTSELVSYKGSFDSKFILGNYYYYKGAMRLLKQYDTFILNGEPYILTTWLFLLLGKLTNKRVILWSHGWYGRETSLKVLVKKIYFSLSSHTLLYGHYAKKLMVKAGIKESKLSVIYNSLDYDKQLAIRSTITESDIYKAHFSNLLPVVLFIGRLTRGKKLHQLLDVLIASNNNGNGDKHWNLVLIGDGEEKKNLNELVRKNKLEERVWFYGATYSEEEIGTLIYNADVCVSPGNVGLTAIHAMSYGCPVITHDNYPYQGPEFESIIVGSTGSFFEKDNINSLVLTIQNWLEKSTELGRAFIREECYRVVDNKYNPYNQIHILKDILNKHECKNQA